MDAVAGPQYLEMIIGQQWQLARAAKPRRTAYALPQPEPNELPIFRAGRSQLELVGYQAGEETVEYSAPPLAKGDQIPGWEIYELWDLVRKESWRTGGPSRRCELSFWRNGRRSRRKDRCSIFGCSRLSL